MFDYSNPSYLDESPDFDEIDYTKLENGKIYPVTARFDGERDTQILAQFLTRETHILRSRKSGVFPHIICPEEVLLRCMFIQDDGCIIDIVLADGLYTSEGRYIPTARIDNCEL